VNVQGFEARPMSEMIEEQEPPQVKLDPDKALTVSLLSLSGGGASGYGRINEKMPGAMREAGLRFSHWTGYDWDLRLAMSSPRAALVGRTPHGGDDLVFHTMFEADPIPPDWVETLNKTRGVWVPSQWCKGSFEQSGVTVPIVVSGYGVDPNVYRILPPVSPETDDWESDERPMLFGWIGASFGDGKTVGDRKNGMQAVTAFVRLKLPNAKLIVKVAERSPTMNVKANNVQFIREDMPESALVALLNELDVLIYPSAGEGFGLVPLEAMACGTPSIVAAFSGMAEYATSENAILLPVTSTEPAWLYRRTFGHECWWAGYDVDDIADRIKWCYEHRKEVRAIGLRAAEEVAAKWTWKDAGERGLEALIAL